MFSSQTFTQKGGVCCRVYQKNQKFCEIHLSRQGFCLKINPAKESFQNSILIAEIVTSFRQISPLPIILQPFQILGIEKILQNNGFKKRNGCMIYND